MPAKPWTKFVLPALGLLGGWLAPRIYRAVSNLGKTEQKLAEDDLEAALKRAEVAKASADPSDDAVAEADVVRAKAMRKRAERLSALADAFAGAESAPPDPEPPKAS